MKYFNSWSQRSSVFCIGGRCLRASWLQILGTGGGYFFTRSTACKIQTSLARYYLWQGAHKTVPIYPSPSLSIYINYPSHVVRLFSERVLALSIRLCGRPYHGNQDVRSLRLRYDFHIHSGRHKKKVFLRKISLWHVSYTRLNRYLTRSSFYTVENWTDVQNPVILVPRP